MSKLLYPRITIVTPSFNQAQFLGRTILSVLDQDYPNLEYIVIDGGSTDGSVEIIKKYEKYITYWVSEKDRGQSEAINKGLRLATGELVAWQNSDDIYLPGAFEQIARSFVNSRGIDLFIGNMNLIDEEDRIIENLKYVTPTYKSLLTEGMVLTNQSAFWVKGIHQKIGYLNESLHYGFDYEWFLRVLNIGKGAHVNKTLGCLRMHNATKTHNFQELFKLEYDKILHNKKISRIQKIQYRVRRLLLMIKMGEFKYILRGFKRRLINLLNSKRTL